MDKLKDLIQQAFGPKFPNLKELMIRFDYGPLPIGIIVHNDNEDPSDTLRLFAYTGKVVVLKFSADFNRSTNDWVNKNRRFLDPTL